MARILVHRPKGMRYTMLRQELLEVFNWDACAAYIAHILESKVGSRLDDIEERGETEGLLWIQISEESLHADMMRQYSTKHIRETLRKMEARGVIAAAKESIGRVKRILYNYEGVDQAVTLCLNWDSLPTGKMSGDPPEKVPVHTGKMSEKFPVEGGGVNTYRKKDEDKQQENPLAELLTASQETETQTQTQTPGPILDSETEPDPGTPALEDEDIADLGPRRMGGSRFPGKKIKDPNRWKMRTLPGKEPHPGLDSIPSVRNGTEAPPAPATQPTAPQTPKPAIPEEAEIWNEIVTAAPRVELFDWEQPEGVNLDRCRRNVKFNTQAWRRICEKVQAVLSADGDKGQFLASFHWLIKADANWWKVLSGQYDHFARKSKTKTDRSGDALAAALANMQQKGKTHANKTA